MRCGSLDQVQRNVWAWHKAAIAVAVGDVRFRGVRGHRASGRQCPLLTHFGRRASFSRT
jgi:hypothetical protein